MRLNSMADLVVIVIALVFTVPWLYERAKHSHLVRARSKSKRSALREYLDDYFDEEELRTLCFAGLWPFLLLDSGEF